MSTTNTDKKVNEQEEVKSSQSCSASLSDVSTFLRLKKRINGRSIDQEGSVLEIFGTAKVWTACERFSIRQFNVNWRFLCSKTITRLRCASERTCPSVIFCYNCQQGRQQRWWGQRWQSEREWWDERRYGLALERVRTQFSIEILAMNGWLLYFCLQTDDLTFLSCKINWIYIYIFNRLKYIILSVIANIISL